MRPQQSSSSKGLPAAFELLATTGALFGTVFMAPSVWPIFEPMAWAKLSQQYDHSTASFLALCMRYGTFPLCFAIIRVGLIAGFSLLMAFTLQRLR